LLIYVGVYVLYLFVNPEHELLHWVTLVIVPAGLVACVGRYRSWEDFIQSVGLRPRDWHGWLLALGLAAAFQCVQLLNSAQRIALRAALAAPSDLVLIPVAFVLVIGTAATTEEFFFRGLVQSRVAARTGSEAAGVAIATSLFVLYHVPYAYLLWPSAGHMGAAVQVACANGLIAGLPLGLLYWRSRHNLPLVIAVHASIDLLPAVRMLSAWAAA